MIDILSKIIREVGDLILIWRNSGFFEGQWEGSQFKAEADQMAHKELKKLLQRLDPSIPVVSEEDGKSLTEKRADRYWLIDPIDGTASFANGFNGFVTQVALIEKSSPMYAAIFAPALDRLYTAQRGGGAFLNDTRLKLNAKKRMDTLIDNYPEPRGIAMNVYCDYGFKNYIECGSISLKICKVADGTADLFIKDVIVRDWDLAAPGLVLEEAGGNLTDIEGRKITYKGSYEHFGLIAAYDNNINSMISSWHSNFKKDNQE